MRSRAPRLLARWLSLHDDGEEQEEEEEEMVVEREDDAAEPEPE
jgi:hypothetical protein|eukprot:COSAG06_NODE_4957_length_3832_cov_14.437450_2_plen_44_part_00